MKIELGKRYRRRDGDITGVIKSLSDNTLYDPDFNQEYSVNGRLLGLIRDSDAHLVEEYVKPVELWAVVNTGRVLTTSLYKSLLEQDYPGLKIIKLREVTDEGNT